MLGKNRRAFLRLFFLLGMLGRGNIKNMVKNSQKRRRYTREVYHLHLLPILPCENVKGLREYSISLRTLDKKDKKAQAQPREVI